MFAQNPNVPGQSRVYRRAGLAEPPRCYGNIRSAPDLATCRKPPPGEKKRKRVTAKMALGGAVAQASRAQRKPRNQLRVSGAALKRMGALTPKSM